MLFSKKKANANTNQSASKTSGKKGGVKRIVKTVVFVCVIFPLCVNIITGVAGAISNAYVKATRETFKIVSVVSEDTVCVRSEKTGTETNVKLFGITADIEDLETLIGARVAFEFDKNVPKTDENGLEQPYFVDLRNERILQMEMLAAGIGTNTIPSNASLAHRYWECATLHSYGD